MITSKRKKEKYYILFFLLLLLFSCREPAPQVPANKLQNESVSEDLMLLNREFAKFENEEINHYVDSLNLDMQRTSTGLRYKIIEEGEGEYPAKGNKVTFRYSVRPLNGIVCEKLDKVVKTIEIGKGITERGLEEAVLMLKVTGKGEFIIPSHLAYGVSGYKDCIAGWTPVFCEINLIENNLK